MPNPYHPKPQRNDFTDEQRQQYREEREKREQLMDMGLDPDDPDPNDLAPEEMHPDYHDDER